MNVNPTRVGDAINEIELALGLAIDGAPHLDDIPRAADYVIEIGAMRRAAFELSEKLGNWNYYFSDQVDLHGGNVSKTTLALAEFVDAAGKAMRKFEGIPSKGAPKNAVLRFSIFRLRKIFSKYYRGPHTNRIPKGSVASLTTQERSEVEFVMLALKDARAVTHGFSQEQLRRLFRHRDCKLV